MEITSQKDQDTLVKTQNLRQVPHPDKLYIQINDEDADTLSFSFNDDYNESIGLNPNVFDDATLDRCEKILSLVFRCINKLRTKGQPIENLNKD